MFNDPLLDGLSEVEHYRSASDDSLTQLARLLVNEGASARTAQALSDYRQRLINQLKALDNFIDEEDGGAFAPVGGVPAPSGDVVADVDARDPVARQIVNTLPAGVDEREDYRGRFGSWAAASKYMSEKNRPHNFVAIINDDGTVDVYWKYE